jgi:hypothetical protein
MDGRTDGWMDEWSIDWMVEWLYSLDGYIYHSVCGDLLLISCETESIVMFIILYNM